MRTNIQTNLRNNVQTNLHNNLRNNVHNNLHNNLQSNVQTNLQSNLHSDMKNDARNALHNNIRNALHIKSKKVLSALLALALILSLFVVTPIMANADDATDLAGLINQFNHGGKGNLTATVSGTTVTVKGRVTGVKNTLDLDIDKGVTVVWGAEYSSDESSSSQYVRGVVSAWSNKLIRLTNGGIFEVAKGGSIINGGTGNAIMVDGDGTSVIISGGLVSATGMAAGSESEGFAAITLTGKDNALSVNAGSVESSGFAAISISINSTRAAVTVNGGTVSATRDLGFPIYNVGPNSVVNVSGGVVSSLGESRCAIFADGDKARINVTGGATYVIGNGGCAIVTGDSFANMAVNVTGGFVFSYGLSISGNTGGTVIRNWVGDPLTISGTAVVCAWSNTVGNTTYSDGSSNDLFVNDGAVAIWTKSGSSGGIKYSNNTNSGFFPLDGITISAAVEKPATPTNLTATAGATGITLNWTDNSDNEEKFIISRKEGVGESTPYGEAAANATTYTDVAVEAGKTYTYYVYASNSAGLSDQGVPVTITMTEGTAPGATPPGEPTPGETTPGDTTAAEPMSNFQKVKTYAPGEFEDVDENSWYGYNGQKVVANAYEYGLMLGYAEGYFGTEANISVVEVIVIATRVRSIYITGDNDEDLLTVEPSGLWSDTWYERYMDYSVAKGIIAATDFSDDDLGRAATRAEMAYIFANALPKEEFPAQNTVNSLPDVDSGTPYRDSIVMLYEAGVVAGGDALGTFYPDNSITRVEAAAIITRVILPETRISGNTYG